MLHRTVVHTEEIEGETVKIVRRRFVRKGDGFTRDGNNRLFNTGVESFTLRANHLSRTTPAQNGEWNA